MNGHPSINHATPWPEGTDHGEFAAVLDTGGHIVSCTPALCALLGYSMEELRGRDIRTLGMWIFPHHGLAQETGAGL